MERVINVLHAASKLGLVEIELSYTIDTVKKSVTVPISDMKPAMLENVLYHAAMTFVMQMIEHGNPPTKENS